MRELQVREEEGRKRQVALEEQVRQLTAANGSLRAHSAQLESAAQQAFAAQRRAENDARNAATREHALQQHNTALERQVSEAAAREAALHQQLDQARQQASETAAAAARLRDAHAALTARAEQQQKHCEALARAREQAAQDNANLRMQQDSLHAQLSELEGQNKQGKAHAQHLIGNMTRLEQTVATASAREEELRTSNQRLYHAAADIQPPVSCSGRPYAPGVTPDAVLNSSPQRTGR